MDGAAAALRLLAAANLRLVVVSNQSGIGRGLITVDEARSVHERFIGLIAGEGIVLDGTKYCPHPPEAGCDCRKPSPGMLLEAAEDLRLDLGRSFMIGDKVSDVEAGERAGCRTVLLGSGTIDGGSTRGPDFVASGLERRGSTDPRVGGRAMKPITELRGSTVLVLGDVMLDEYIWGEARRISPEAPVPIVEVNSRTHRARWRGQRRRRGRRARMRGAAGRRRR